MSKVTMPRKHKNDRANNKALMLVFLQYTTAGVSVFKRGPYIYILAVILDCHTMPPPENRVYRDM
jgi:hypothetical protein